MRPEALLDHHPAGGLAGEEGALDVDVHGQVEVGLGDVLGRVGRAETRVVHQDVEPAEPAHGGVDRRADPVQVADVHRQARGGPCPRSGRRGRCRLPGRGAPGPRRRRRAPAPARSRCPARGRRRSPAPCVPGGRSGESRSRSAPSSLPRSFSDDADNGAPPPSRPRAPSPDRASRWAGSQRPGLRPITCRAPVDRSPTVGGWEADPEPARHGGSCCGSRGPLASRKLPKRGGQRQS
jgi:hypothetical protein